MKKWGAHQGRLPTLNHLIALEATARLGSFSAAAQEMHLTQGAVAQQIRGLEKDLGGPLFDRLPRGLQANHKGKDYINRLKLALGIIEEATKVLLEKESLSDQNQIMLSTTPSFASRWLIPRLPKLYDTYPNLSVMIDASNTIRRFHGENKVDMAVRWGTAPFADGHARFLLPGKAIPVCSPDFLQGKERLNPENLEGISLISDSHNNWQNWYDSFGVTGSEVHGPVFSLSSHALEAAEQGMGIALVPKLLVQAALESGRLVEAMPEEYQLDTKAGYFLVTNEQVADESALGKVINWMLEEAKIPPQNSQE
ncbi:LysR substrate-binding domain-containing protein [Marinomonas algicola]|uniref:LysR substrate-binding domain-containing protein n=1 Tax=Marinomonas algicola TaxID=2773454 RepID=UPI00174D8B2B|nr:LysR substrate-binding domain-containing protein [Marinomonas algicola]